MKIWKAVMYTRLSKDDGINLESESIINQKEYIRKYVSSKNDIILIDDDNHDYCDDGCSGGNFNRDAWMRMLCDIEKEDINCIITKDLSRMGRDYIEMGRYIETFFPEKNIRYIAINDDIDTLYETPGLEYLQFKLIFNDFFLKDTSKKIRRILRLKKEMGNYTGWKGIYGYKRDVLNKHKLVVDDDVKDVVIRMFNLVKSGYSLRNIARLFNEEGIDSPSKHANILKSNNRWSPKTIKELLENPTYLGHLVQGRRKKLSYKSKKEIRIPKDEWIIVKNVHEAIVDENTFSIVQDILLKKKNIIVKNDYLLKGLLYCKECKHKIGIIKSNDKKRRYTYCSYYNTKRLCSPHSINYDKLEIFIIKHIINKCDNTLGVSRELLLLLIDKIEISKDKKIYVYYKSKI